MLNYDVTIGLNPKLFIATFCSSVLTASLGIAKFLKVGPCRLVPDEGILGGFGNPCFLLLVFNVVLTLISRGILLLALEGDLRPRPSQEAILHWVAICYLPQMLYVSMKSIMCFLNRKMYMIIADSFQAFSVLLSNIGPKRTLRLMFQFPALFLTPVFSFWTFGDKKGCYFCKTQIDRKVQVSFTLSWINFSLSVITNTGLLINNLTKARVLGHSIFHIISCSCLVLSGFTLKFIQNLKSLKRTVLDPDSPSQVIETSTADDQNCSFRIPRPSIKV